MKLNEYIEITNEDNMELMARYPDKYFDLAIVDPPYRNANENQPTKDMRRNGKIEVFGDKPDSKYFEELFRVSKNQIVCGGNYFTDFLFPNNAWIFWYKHHNYADGEFIWTSFNDKQGKCFDYMYYGAINSAKDRFHSTEKPVALYAWILKNYAKQGDKILDTHFGSGSIACAVHKANIIDKMDLSLVACELDKDYFESSIQRVKAALQTLSLF